MNIRALSISILVVFLVAGCATKSKNEQSIPNFQNEDREFGMGIIAGVVTMPINPLTPYLSIASIQRPMSRAEQIADVATATHLEAYHFCIQRGRLAKIAISLDSEEMAKSATFSEDAVYSLEKYLARHSSGALPAPQGEGSKTRTVDLIRTPFTCVRRYLKVDGLGAIDFPSGKNAVVVQAEVAHPGFKNGDTVTHIGKKQIKNYDDYIEITEPETEMARPIAVRVLRAKKPVVVQTKLSEVTAPEFMRIYNEVKIGCARPGQINSKVCKPEAKKRFIEFGELYNAEIKYSQPPVQ